MTTHMRHTDSTAPTKAGRRRENFGPGAGRVPATRRRPYYDVNGHARSATQRDPGDSRRFGNWRHIVAEMRRRDVARRKGEK